MSSENLPSISSLNLAALGSILGLSKDWRSGLVSLLRSGEEIDWAVRHELASAIEGATTTGTRLILQNHEKTSRWSSSLKDRREWYQFGLQVAAFLERSKTAGDRFLDAEEEFGRPESYCRKSYYYLRHCNEWKASARKSGRCYRSMSDMELETEFHLSSIEQKTSKPTPLAAAEYDQLIAAKGRIYKEIAEAMDLGDWQSDALIEILFTLGRLPNDEDL
jgi:DNA-binding CsgD family transcriptional regulator